MSAASARRADGPRHVLHDPLAHVEEEVAGALRLGAAVGHGPDLIRRPTDLAQLQVAEAAAKPAANPSAKPAAKGGKRASGYTDTGVMLIAGKPVAGVESKDTKLGLDLCWGNK